MPDAISMKTKFPEFVGLDDATIAFAIEEVTVDLDLGNYWFEISIDSAEDKHTTVTEGIMTLVRTENPVLV